MSTFSFVASLCPKSSFFLLGCLIALYFGTRILYRLCLAPVARFPGPKFAALTYFYEFYYDVWLGGKYTWKLRELHRKYGVC